MWCLAPDWPEHARHVAVEFVHPVIMGKRALPAVAVVDDDPVPRSALVARSGDILCAVCRCIRRPVWPRSCGAPTSGASPRCGSARVHDRRPVVADHVLWVDADHPVAAYDGRLVLRYHLLWELTHVCFEHPGLLAAVDAACEVDGTCITCSDEGTVAEVLAIDASGAASVRTARGAELVDVNLVGPVAAGDLVLVHAGAAIAVVDTSEPPRVGDPEPNRARRGEGHSS